MLALSSLSSLLQLLLLLLLLLLLGALLVHADGAAWVRAALVRDLICRTSCSTCSCVSCRAALICSACASIAAWSSKTKIFWPARRPLHCCFLRLSLSPFHLLLRRCCCRCCWGRRGPGGGRGASLRSCLQQPKKNFVYTNPAQPRRIKIYIFKLSAITPQGK